MEGLLLVDKPSGPTSYDIIRWIKRKTNTPNSKVKIGHCGTLDPLASGLMLILLGRGATKKQAEYMGRDKVYRCEMKLGVRTDTGDVTGAVLENKSVPEITPDLMDEVARGMIGPQNQVPPMFSALKVGGTPLYKLARKGVSVKREARPIMIYEFKFLCSTADTLEFRLRCSSGTYVRTLVEEVGAKLGTVATMRSLVREKIGEFDLTEAVSGESLKNMDEHEMEARLRAVA